MIFDTAFAYVVGEEGKLSLDSKDPGNWTGGSEGIGELKGTKFGISAKAYPHLDIENLTIGQAKDIYQTDFWVPARCPLYPDAVALMVFDAAVNQGVGTAKRMLQEALCVRADGNIGPQTLGALHLADQRILAAEFRDVRIQHYQSDNGWAYEGKGWTNRANATCLKSCQLV